MSNEQVVDLLALLEFIAFDDTFISQCFSFQMWLDGEKRAYDSFSISFTKVEPRQDIYFLDFGGGFVKSMKIE